MVFAAENPIIPECQIHEMEALFGARACRIIERRDPFLAIAQQLKLISCRSSIAQTRSPGQFECSKQAVGFFELHRLRVGLHEAGFRRIDADAQLCKAAGRFLLKKQISGQTVT